MRLHEIQPKHGSTHRTKRLGCGESSGHGKTSGKGHKGQKARSGGTVRLGFEGGQMPIYRRLPKRGFSNAQFKKIFAVVNLDDLDAFDAGSSIDEALLRAAGLVRGNVDGVKILARGVLSKKLTVTVDHFSAAAKEAIEKAGGTAEIRVKSAPQPATAA